MFSSLFGRMRFRSAARKYAENLSPQLQKDYGASTFYTANQIALSADRAKLPAEYIAFGYAEFLKEEDFLEASSRSTLRNYQELREILQANVPRRPVLSGFSSASGPAIQGEGQG